MKYKTKSYVVSQMVKDYEKDVGKNNRLVFDCPIQRPEGQYNNVAQSLVIHSILQGYIIPNVYIVQHGADDFEPMTVLDGKQRMTIIYNYVTNGFKLSKATPPVKIIVPEIDEDGNLVKDENGLTVTKVEYIEIKNLKYDKLPKEFQDALKNFELTVTLITEATKEELEEQMFRLNNGKTPTATQKAFMKGGIDVADAIQKTILENNFFTNRFIMSPAQKKGSEDMKCAFHTLAILTDADFNKLTSGDLTKIAENMKNDWKDGKISEADIQYCNELLEDLNYWLPEEDDFVVKDVLTTVHIPIMVMNVEKARQLIDDGDLTPTQYKDFLKYWVKRGIYKEGYRECSEGSPSDKANIERRIDIMEKELEDFISAPDDIFEFINEFESEENAIKSLVVASNCPHNGFEPETLEKVKNWAIEDASKDEFYMCLGYKKILDMIGIDENNEEYLSMLFAAKYIMENHSGINAVDLLENLDVKMGITKPITNADLVEIESNVIKKVQNLLYEGDNEDENVQ